MNRKDFYFKQKVKATELDAAFEDVELALASFLQGFGYVGIAEGAVVTQNSPTNLTVVVSGPAIVYDQNQKHIQWFPNQVVNCALDENGAATAVPGVGNERWLSLFAEYAEVLSDPRIDGNGDTIYFSKSEGFAINVVQGAEAGAGVGVRPPLRGDQILIADVKLVYGQTAIVNANISTTRSELIYDLTGSPNAIKERSLQAALQSMLDQLNGFDSDSISADAISDSPLSLSAGTLEEQTTELLGHVNTLKTDLEAADATLTTGLNHVHDEIDNALTAAGLTPSEADETQLTTVLDRMRPKVAIYEAVASALAPGRITFGLLGITPDTGFIRQVSNTQIFLPSQGLYRVTVNMRLTCTDTTNPLPCTALIQNVSEGSFGLQWILHATRYSANAAHYIDICGSAMLEVTSGGIIAVFLNNGPAAGTFSADASISDDHNNFVMIERVRYAP